MSTQYALNGYVLPGTQQRRGMWLVQGTEYAPALAARRADVFVPQVSYALPLWDDPISNITLTLQVRIKGDDVDDLREQWNGLIGLLRPGGLVPITVTRYRGTHTDEAEAQLISTTTPDFNCPGNTLNVSILLNIPGGAWRGPYVDQQVFEPEDEPDPFLAGIESTLPIVDALIRVTGPVPGTVEVTTANGTGVTFNGAGLGILAGEWLLIDVYNMRALIKSDNGWDTNFYDTDVSGKLAFISRGPLSISNFYSGPVLTPSSYVIAIRAVGTGQVWVRARSAVA